MKKSLYYRLGRISFYWNMQLKKHVGLDDLSYLYGFAWGTSTFFGVLVSRKIS